ncbi:MAG TPA: hypoxanthine phosphoribosyltransferase [Fimbriimonadaceae bacterium]|nr:hypoxanthine phosphoribosyltransferase [Fimbriimonadaceae bacterium]
MLEPLISADRLQRRIDELAAEIARDYQGKTIFAVAILKGSVYFLADLTRRLGENLELDFMQVSSYHGGSVSSGNVQIRKDLDTNIEGRDVLLVEDIVDTGTTLDHLRELLSVRKPSSLKVVSLLSKRTARGIRTPVEYVGFEIPEAFVVGYGLDYAERYRNLPYISILREDCPPATLSG